jgi:predicted small integral membrane protein
MEQPRFQIDVLDFDAERARSAAAAIIDWLAVVDFSSDSQFASPVTSPTRHPNFVLNQRADMDFTLQPPAYVEILDVRIFSLEG